MASYNEIAIDEGAGNKTGVLYETDVVTPLENTIATLTAANTTLTARITALEAGETYIEPTYTAGTYVSVLSSVVEDSIASGWESVVGFWQYIHDLSRPETTKYFVKMAFTLNGTTHNLEGMMDPVVPEYLTLNINTPIGTATGVLLINPAPSLGLKLMVVVENDSSQNYPVVITSLEIAPAIED